MQTILRLEYADFAQLLLCVGLLFFIIRRGAFREFKALSFYAAIVVLTGMVDIPVLFFRKYLGISKLTAYNIIFYTTWPAVIVEAVVMVFIVYGVYSLALEPFEPLRKLGTIIFRWVAAISVAVSICVAIGPHMSGQAYVLRVVSEVQQSASVLTLCLLLFVCFALRPLGITPRSRAFGASLGLGVMAAVELIQAAWFPTPTALSVYSPVFLYGGIGYCITYSIWFVYFAMPEPERRMVLLPTTSPYFFWNRISEALGDSPGFVAVRGFTPDSLAPAELSAMLVVNEEVDAAPRVLQPIAVNQ